MAYFYRPYCMCTVSSPTNTPQYGLEGKDFTHSFGFEARSTPNNITRSRDGQVISNGTRIATSVSTISITSTTRSGSGVYEVVSYNEAGRGAANFTWSKDGQVISSGTRIATSVSTITITSTTRSDSGVYEVVSYNEAGRGAANFTLDVQCEEL